MKKNDRINSHKLPHTTDIGHVLYIPRDTPSNWMLLIFEILFVYLL